MEPLLSVIIVSWNTRELLHKCLTSLYSARSREDDQIIVVDNASSDGSGEMVQQAFPAIELIVSERNLGFALANNYALDFARGKYVLFLNPDTEVQHGAIEALIQHLDTHQEAGAIGTTLLNPDGTLQLYCNRYYGLWHSLRHNWIVAKLLRQQGMACTQRPGELRSVGWMLGACLAIRRSVLEQVGGFDPRFFVYGEEMDLQYRIKKSGWEVVYVPSPGVIHFGGRSTTQAGLIASLHEYRGRWIFVRKHYANPIAVAYLLKTMAGLVVGMIYWGARVRARSTPAAGRQLHTYYRLFAWHLGGCRALPVPAIAPTPQTGELHL